MLTETLRKTIPCSYRLMSPRSLYCSWATTGQSSRWKTHDSWGTTNSSRQPFASRTRIFISLNACRKSSGSICFMLFGSPLGTWPKTRIYCLPRQSLRSVSYCNQALRSSARLLAALPVGKLAGIGTGGERLFTPLMFGNTIRANWMESRKSLAHRHLSAPVDELFHLERALRACNSPRIC